MRSIQIMKCFGAHRFALLLSVCFVLGAKAQMPVGLQLYTFRDQIPKDVPGMLKKISEMGFRYLEGGGTYKLPKEEFKSLLQQNHLQIVSYGADFKELQDQPEKVAEGARFFGATYVMCAWVPHNGTTFRFDDAKKAVDVFNKAGKLLAAKGLKLVYHAHGYEFQPYANGTLFDYMLKNMNPAYANFEMDVFWFRNSGQDPAAYLLKYPKRFLLLHLKDRKPGTPENVTAQADVETNVELGTGDVNIPAVMKAAKKIGIQYAFIEDESSRSLEQVPKSVAYLKRLQK